MELKKLKKEEKRLSILVNLIKKDRQIDPVPDCPSLSHDNTAGLDTKPDFKGKNGEGGLIFLLFFSLGNVRNSNVVSNVSLLEFLTFPLTLI